MGGDAAKWEKVVRKLRTARCRRGPAAAGCGGSPAFVASLSGARPRRRRAQSGPSGRPPAEPRRVRERDPRPARARHRSAGAAAGRRCGRARFRQHRRRAVGVAGAARALHVGGAARSAAWRSDDRRPIPVIETYNVPRMLVQDGRMSEDLPFGSRGGLAVRHRLPGRWRILRSRSSCRPTSTTTSAARPAASARGAGRRRAGRQRSPSAARTRQAGARELRGRHLRQARSGRDYAHDADAGLEVRFPPRRARTSSASVRRRRPHEPKACCSPARSAIRCAINEMSDGQSGDRDRRDQRAVYTRRARATRRAGGGSSCAARANGETRSRARRQILSTLARRAYRRPVDRRDVRTLLDFLRRGRARAGGFEPGIQRALERCSSIPSSCSAIERDPAGRRRRARRIASAISSSRPGCRSSSGAASRTMSCSSSRRADGCRSRRCSSAGAAACSPTSALEGARGQLRRPVAGAAQRPRAHAPIRTLPEFDENLREAIRRETELFLESQLREDRSVARPADARTTRSSTSGWPGTTASRTSTASASAA